MRLPDVDRNPAWKAAGLSSLALVAAGSAALAYQASGELVHDVAWYFYATGRWIDGARLYVDIVEVNPPLVFYLMSPAVVLSRLTGTQPVVAVALYVVASALACLLLSLRILRRAIEGDESFIWTSLLITATLTTLFVPFHAFAQREHLALILALPFVFCRAVRVLGHAPGRASAIEAGLLAGVGLSLKPYFLLLPLVLEIWDVRRTGRPVAKIRPETVSALGVVAVYAVTVLLVHDEYLRDTVPVALATYGHGYGLEPFRLVTRVGTLFGTVAILTWWIARRFGGLSPSADAFGWTALAFFGAYLLQGKGFLYQVYPVMALGAIAVAPLVFSGGRAGGFGSLYRTARVLSGSLLIVYFTLAFLRPVNPLVRDLDVLVRREARGGTIASLGGNVSVGFPLVLEVGVEWGSRYPALWPLPGAWKRLRNGGAWLSHEDRGELQRILSSTRAAVTEDLRRYRPDVMLVEGVRATGPDSTRRSPYLAWALEDPDFRRMWSEYDSVGAWGPVTVYGRTTRLRDGKGTASPD